MYPDGVNTEKLALLEEHVTCETVIPPSSKTNFQSISEFNNQWGLFAIIIIIKQTSCHQP